MSDQESQNKSHIQTTKMYFEILSKVTGQVNWLIFSILTISATIFLMIFTWHFGILNTATYREEAHANHLQSNISKNNHLKDSISLSQLETNLRNKSIKRLDSLIKKDSIDLKKSENYIIDLNKLGERTQTCSVPFLGLTLTWPDFAIGLYLIGLVFLAWLYVLLRYAKNVLKNLFNMPDEEAMEVNAIHNLFYLVFPGNERIVKYNYLENLILIFIIVLVSVFISDIFELFVLQETRGVAIFDLIGNDPSLAIRTLLPDIVLFIAISISILFYFRFKKILNDVRNVLILIRWGAVSLIPAIGDLISKKLVPKKNWLFYGLFDFDNEEKMFLKLTFEDGSSKLLLVKLQLAHSLISYNKKIKPSEFYKSINNLSNVYIGNNYMKYFFISLLRDNALAEKEFNNEFNINFAEIIKDNDK